MKGIYVNGIEHKITQFADDTTLILDGTKDSLIAALNILEVFGSISGLQINTEKTKLIWIGKNDTLVTKLTLGRIWTGETPLSLSWVSNFQ